MFMCVYTYEGRQLQMKAMEHLIATQPFKTVLAVELTPIPMEWVNYLFANTEVRIVPFAAAVILTRFFSKGVLSVYVGSLAHNLNDILTGKVGISHETMISLIVTFVLLLASFVLSYVLYRKAKQWMIDRTGDSNSNDNNNYNVQQIGLEIKAALVDEKHVLHDHDVSSSNPLDERENKSVSNFDVV
ncbi:hypothetical protein RFI_27904 [Reticulomyxa filosa]|uniref:SNARE associated Golgi protein n=1 Tax=Reticulomyxa filosa TaxID=46433 RepID=X6M656_RETFI|nr:hypothetical protein RFI_27904 [Reticulomyxa filosa]|eukprot:ETO09473.1 hypothetical protein RFI_27904 [Reticulomyxa filosa]